MGPLLLKLAVGLALLVFLFRLFRFAMALRFDKLLREEARLAHETRGRRVVAEVPTASGELELFLEDAEGFYWRGSELCKPEVIGARLLLNGGVMAACARPGLLLPDPPLPEEFEGRERWDVALYLSDGGQRLVPCGSLREGVSRGIAAQVFQALREDSLRAEQRGPGSQG